jgi:predicted transcriptional regulator
MKNITVTVDDELYRRSRRYAAEHDTTVTALVREAISNFAYGETEAERLLREEGELYARLDSRRERHVDEGFATSQRDALYRNGNADERAAAA